MTVASQQWPLSTTLLLVAALLVIVALVAAIALLWRQRRQTPTTRIVSESKGWVVKTLKENIYYNVETNTQYDNSLRGFYCGNYNVFYESRIDWIYFSMKHIAHAANIYTIPPKEKFATQLYANLPKRGTLPFLIMHRLLKALSDLLSTRNVLLCRYLPP